MSEQPGQSSEGIGLRQRAREDLNSSAAKAKEFEFEMTVRELTTFQKQAEKDILALQDDVIEFMNEHCRGEMDSFIREFGGSRPKAEGEAAAPKKPAKK